MQKCITTTICNELGMHARAAASFVKKASEYKSDIIVKKDEFEVNGKSIMGLIMLSAPKGSVIEICATGEDASDCLQSLESLINNKFGEDA